MQVVDPTFGLCLFTFLTILITFGVIGNVLSFVTWSTGKRCRHLPISSYFKPLAIVDTCILLFPAMELLVNLSPAHLVFREINIVFCKLFPFVMNSSLRLSTWITVTFSIEKVLHIYLSFKFPFKRNHKRVFLIIGILSIISYGIGIPFLVDLTIVTVNDSQFTNYSLTNLTNTSSSTIPTSVVFNDDYVRSLVYMCAPRHGSFTDSNYLRLEMFFNVFALFVLPFSVLLVCNILILLKMMKRSNSTMGRMNEQQHTLRQKQFKYATYQVIALSLVQCISTLPNSIMDVLLIIQPSDGTWMFQQFFEVYYLFNCFTYLNSAVNFILYCSVGSDFRQDFMELFHLCRT